MTPRGDTRGNRFNFMVNAEERAMLEALAEADQRTAGDWLRVKIREAYVQKVAGRKPKKPQK